MGWRMIVWLVLGLVGLYLVLGIILRLTGGYAPGWQVRCRRCGTTRDAAEVGVVRVGRSTGKVTGTFGWCGHCRGLRTFVVERMRA
jgi:hypothetical protein